MTPLEKSILATLAYYDILNKPLTGWEVFRYLIRTSQKKYSFCQILKTLENSPVLSKYIRQKQGFYYLSRKKNTIKQRIERQKISEKKWKKAKIIIKFLQVIPFVRLVVVSGSLAMNNTKEESDIDLLIITQSGRIWTARGLITLFVHLLGQRRHGELTKDRICLNHYLTEQSLNIPWESLYNAQTYAHLTPVYGQNCLSLFRKFQKNNQWLKKYLVSFPYIQRGYSRKIKRSVFLDNLRQSRELVFGGRVGDVVEKICRKIQIYLIKKNPLTYQEDGRVIFNNNQLEFHPHSPEKKILHDYNKKIKELGLKDVAVAKDSGLVQTVRKPSKIASLSFPRPPATL